MYKEIAMIRANDEIDGEEIVLGLDQIDDGYRVIASNGDDIGYYKAQTMDKCVQDIIAMYDRWDSFVLNY